eukprot:SAG11_NODE_21064_length_432_cov_10.033033_1_plen_83_part_01
MPGVNLGHAGSPFQCSVLPQSKHGFRGLGPFLGYMGLSLATIGWYSWCVDIGMSPLRLSGCIRSMSISGRSPFRCLSLYRALW